MTQISAVERGKGGEYLCNDSKESTVDRIVYCGKWPNVLIGNSRRQTRASVIDAIEGRIGNVVGASH